jgi:dolichol-phosphate mannosyltransferase
VHPKVLVTVVTFNEGEKLKALVPRFSQDGAYDLLFIDDGSNDGSDQFLESLEHRVIRHQTNLGVGAGIRDAVKFGRQNGYDIIVIMAGNGKMQPEEIPQLIQPILDDRADYVQGSRYLEGGRSPNLPLFRRVTIRLFTAVVNLAIRFNGTDITCGFRAYRLNIFDHPEINIDQDWLGRYEMEYYIHYKVATLGFRMTEAPVAMVYPAENTNYSKIKPLVDWWSMVRPWIFLILRLKK